MANYWDPTDQKTIWSIEKEILEMINRGRMRAYDRLFEGSVEDIRLNSDGSALISIYGKDENDERGHWHIAVRVDPNGHILSVENCRKTS